MQMSGAELETEPSSVFRTSFYKNRQEKEVLLLSPDSHSQHICANIHQTYLEIVVGAAERSLDGGARCCIEVASHGG